MEKLAEQDRAAILEALDGADAKDARRIIIGTTNFIEQMDRAMIREGRFNDVVHCGLPDRQAFEQMLRIALVRNIDGKEVSFIGDHVDFDAAWCEINPDGTEVPHFQGFSFAFISGAVQNILRSYVVRNKGNISNLKVSTEDLIVAADGKREHFALMGMEPPPQPKQLDDLLDAMFRAAVSEEQSDLTDYSEINSRTWDTVKDLIDDTRVNLETESGKPITGVLDQRS
jgi:SpoVK/Ycf46/Vps4 family AAA+-type ATPase